MSCVSRLRFLSALSLCALLALPLSAGAQSGDPRTGDQQRAAQAEAAKDQSKRPDDFSEAARALSGSPAAEPECVWLGRRAVNLLWRDDLDTAFRHLGLYDRFGCPNAHLQATFRCVVRQGSIDPKMQESLGTRVHACWINPNLEPQAPVAAAPQAQTPAQGQGAPSR